MREEYYLLQTYYIQKTELIGQSLDNVPQFFTSIGLGFSTNLGINLNTGDMGINYNLFNGEFNVNCDEINISSQFMTGEQ